MITRPLELESRLSPPPRDLDFFAWVNLGLIALFFTLLGSRFVLAPGLLVGSADFRLPAAPGLQAFPTARVVVSYRQGDVIVFEGAIIKPDELREHLAAYAKQHPGEILMMRADQAVSSQAIADLAAMAQAVGFANLLIAGEAPPPDNRLK